MMKKEFTIHTGEALASREPAIIHTLLGSCVGVCLYDPVERMGGMNHILLPSESDMKKFDDSARYGINEMEILIAEIMKQGGDRRRLVAKAFGGAQIIPALSKKDEIGSMIISFVMKFLEKEKINLVSKDVGGNTIRKVSFHTDTGKAIVSHSSAINHVSILMDELRWLRFIKQKIREAGAFIIFKSEK